jgi:hypothetical protein
VLVPFRDAAAIATAVTAILDEPDRKKSLESRAYEYGKQMAWPAIGRRVLALMRDVIERRAPSAPVAVPLELDPLTVSAKATPKEELEEELEEEPSHTA